MSTPKNKEELNQIIDAESYRHWKFNRDENDCQSSFQIGAKFATSLAIKIVLEKFREDKSIYLNRIVDKVERELKESD